MTALELRDVEVVYDRRDLPPVRAVAGVSLSVERGQIVGLVGESGCGKSTLARAAVGLVAPSAGEIAFNGRPVTPLSHRARDPEAVRLQMLFQNPYSSLNPRRRIGAQLADARPTRTVAELLEQVGLPASVADRYPHQFSGGQRQRIAIARALAAEPSVIVLDEPLSSLDASAQAQIANLLEELARDLDLGLLLISHDLSVVHHVADVVAVMYLGTIAETAPTRALWERPLHPYTQALIAAIPDGELPEPLPGEVPDPAAPPPGCRFHPRCPHAMDRCRTQPPALDDVEPDRTVACWLHDRQGAGWLPNR